MAFAQTLQNCQKIMLAISSIWLCLFCENSSILNKIPILGQAPRPLLIFFLFPRKAEYMVKATTVEKPGTDHDLSIP